MADFKIPVRKEVSPESEAIFEIGEKTIANYVCNMAQPGHSGGPPGRSS
jgi:hypothetical protein